MAGYQVVLATGCWTDVVVPIIRNHSVMGDQAQFWNNSVKWSLLNKKNEHMKKNVCMWLAPYKTDCNLILTQRQKPATWKWSLLRRRRSQRNTRVESRNHGVQCLSTSRPDCHQGTAKHRWRWRRPQRQCSYITSTVKTWIIKCVLVNTTSFSNCCVIWSTTAFSLYLSNYNQLSCNRPHPYRLTPD